MAGILPSRSRNHAMQSRRRQLLVALHHAVADGSGPRVTVPDDAALAHQHQHQRCRVSGRLARRVLFLSLHQRLAGLAAIPPRGWLVPGRAGLLGEERHERRVQPLLSGHSGVTRSVRHAVRYRETTCNSDRHALRAREPVRARAPTDTRDNWNYILSLARSVL